MVQVVDKSLLKSWIGVPNSIMNRKTRIQAKNVNVCIRIAHEWLREQLFSDDVIFGVFVTAIERFDQMAIRN